MKTPREISGDILLIPGDYTVSLSSCGNPDHGQDPTRPMYGVQNETIKVSSMEDASLMCRLYIEENDLGGGNWTGGQITENGRIVAYVSYNGRVWEHEVASCS